MVSIDMIIVIGILVTAAYVIQQDTNSWNKQ